MPDARPGRADEVREVARLLEPWENLSPQYKAAQMLRAYADLLEPYEEGAFITIGPECFADREVGVICWKGENYYREDRCAPLVEAIEHYIAFCKRGAVSPNVYFWAEDALRAYREREPGQ